MAEDPSAQRAPAPIATMTDRAHRHRLERLRQRARDLQEAPAPGIPVRPSEPVAEALVSLQRVVGSAGWLLVLGGLAGALALGDPRAGLLAAVPGGLLVALGLAGRDRRRRRVTCVMATSVAGFLALASAPGLAGLAEGSPGAAYQVGCLVVATAILVVAWPAWREANTVESSAKARRALYDEQ